MKANTSCHNTNEFMKIILLILSNLALLLSCNSTDPVNTTANDQQADTTQAKVQRQLLIRELKRLKTVFASKDKERIADVFEFPLSDTAAGIYIDDSSF